MKNPYYTLYWITVLVLVAVIFLSSIIPIVAALLRHWRRRRAENAWWKSRGAWFVLFLLFALPSLGKAQAHYRFHGKFVLPDAKYSPGESRKRDIVSSDAPDTYAVWHDLLKESICSPLFRTAKYRHTSFALKLQVCKEYGIKTACPGRAYKIDHIVSLWLGGADTLKNLYPQPTAQARIKDRLELFLHRQVCSGKMTLDYAQFCIANDWVACSERELKK